MISKTFKFTNFFGIEVEKEYLFDISAVEVMEKEITTPGGGYQHMLETAFKEKDHIKLYETFRTFILDAVGVISDDGNSFIKDEKHRKEFVGSPAYEQLILSFFGDNGPDVAAAFVEGIFPADMVKEAKQKQAEEKPE